jgi:hypothetical protein
MNEVAVPGWQSTSTMKALVFAVALLWFQPL